MKQTIYIGIISVLMASCASLTPFTNTERDNNDWSNEQLKQIQFYLSQDITLQRKLTSESSEITSGKIRIVNGERVEEVVIRQGTPGILEWTGADNRLGISFEEGDERFLMFGPNPDRGGRYYLLASDWKNKIGKVKYEGKTWFVSQQSGQAFLTVDMRKLKKQDVEKRTAKGRKIE